MSLLGKMSQRTGMMRLEWCRLQITLIMLMMQWVYPLSIHLLDKCVRIDGMQACDVNFDGKKYTFRATRRYGALSPPS